jgi:hypothetical protein
MLMRIQGPWVRLPQALWLCSFLRAYTIRLHNVLLCSEIQPRASKGASVTTVIGRMGRLKLLHMQALSRIASGLVIKMKTASHVAIGLNYGPIGRKYWTTSSLAFTLKMSIWTGSLRNPRSHGRVAENGLAARQSSKGIRKFRV